MEEDIRKIDEASTSIVRTIPSFLYSFYSELVKLGFNESQAMELTKKQLENTKGD